MSDSEGESNNKIVLEQAKMNKRIAKANLTKLENWFNSKVDVQISSTLLELKIDQLTNAYTKFSIAIETLEDESQILSSPDESEAFDERYCMLMSNLKTRLSQLSKNSEVKSERTQNLSIPPTVHLPEIKIPIFSGNPTEWVSFFQLFEAIILNNQSLPAVQKFVYLKSFLRDEPLKLIQNISVSHQNFQVALDILKKRYDNKHVLANSLISGILDINPITKGTAEQLRDFHTNVNENLEALKNLNLTSEQMVDMFLIYSLERKLDYATKRNFEFERDNSHYPTLNEFLGSIDDRCIGLENLKSLDGSSATNKKLQKVSLTTEVSTNLNSLVQIQGQCIFCHGTHKIYSCERFRALPHSEKYNFIKSKQLCVNCFGKHPTSNCASKFLCSVCNKNHHTILHDNKFTNSVTQRGQNKNKSNHITQQSNTNFSRPETRAFNQSGSVPNVSDRETTSHPQEQISQTLNVLSVNKTNSHVLLGTAQVFMYSSEGRKVKAKAILDPGSQHSFITSKLVRNLGYTTYDSKLSISGIGISSTMSNSMVNLVAHSEIDKFKIKLSCSVLENITSSLPQILIDHAKIKLPSQVKLADETYFSPSSIDILIGADFYYELLLDGIIRLGKNLPVLISTRLGWIVVGHAPQKINSSISSWSGVTATTSLSSVESCEESSNAVASAVVLHSQANDFCNLETMVERFWTLEQIPDPKINLSTEEELVENTFISTTHQLEGGSFQVDLPLKSPHENIKLGRSLPIAKQRFFNLEKRFRNNSNYFVDYKRFIDEYIHLGHGRYVPLSEYNANSELKYFLPHHAVLRQDAVTTKLRVVFDASCKTDSGLSLNDIMYKGFQVQPNLFDILLRFRSYNYVLVGDIEKMFWCIQVNPSHTFLQNILWRDNPEQPLRCIELTTLTFGTNCAPFLATRVLNKIAMDNEYKFPLASKSLLSQTYVDDILSGCNSFDELQRLYSELSAMLNPCGFHLHKWHSNSKEFSKKFSLSTSAEIDLNKEEATSKVLGLKWNTLNDCFTISVPKFEIFGPITKKKILSCVAQCWDPLGFLAPVVILGKLIIKATWNMKVNWDTEINDELITLEWNKFIQNIYSLNSLTIPRYFFSGKTISSIQIHGFSDASSKAYAACIYVRALYDDGTISSHLATSKSRVAPQKVISIPRLELSAMLLLVQLVNTFLTVFRETLSFSEIHLYSDSEIALYWISSLPSRWTTFVANRVSKIQSASSQCKWHFVKSQKNPADLPSRGVQPCELLNSTLWWHGPHFLNQNPLNLKSFQTEKEVHAASQEAKRITLLVKSEQNCDEFWEPLFLKFSNFSKCQSVLAYVIRFINNIRLSKAKADKSTGPLSVTELEESEVSMFKSLQRIYFSKEILEIKNNKPLSNKGILRLQPFIREEDGLLRVGGRLNNSNLSLNQKHPILLPSKNHLVSLLLKREHIRLGHGGAQTLLSNIRLKYWPLNGLREVKNIIHHCVTCFRLKPTSYTQIMADLPKDRVTMDRPFNRVGVDYAGPVFLKSSSLRKASLEKAYIAVFICMVTKAIHLELVTSLTSEAFILALKRFISRRGNPSYIFSDNGTNFSGARNQLYELHKFLVKNCTNQFISNFCSSNKINFKFIPPNSPHWGGIWEAAVKNVKFHLVRLVGNANLNFEFFYTVLTQIEAILNSRPICSLSNDPNDLQALTPGHFLVGTSLTSYPEKDFTSTPDNRLSLWHKISHIQQTFWKRWSIEYLNTLQKRPKWLTPSRNLAVNDLVILKEDNMKPLQWPLARILEIFSGPDNKVRVIKLKTSSGEYMRPVTKVCPLPFEDRISTPQMKETDNENL